MSSLAGRLPRQPGDERDKPDQAQILGRKAAVVAADAHQLLVAVIGADWRHQNPARRQPIDQGAGSSVAAAVTITRS